MACRIALRNVILTELRLPLPSINHNFCSFRPIKTISTSNLSCGCKISLNSKGYQFSRYCSNKGDSSSSTDDSDQAPPQEAVLKAISGLYIFPTIIFNVFFFCFSFPKIYLCCCAKRCYCCYLILEISTLRVFNLSWEEIWSVLIYVLFSRLLFRLVSLGIF